MECKNGAEHLQSLRDGRTVCLDGKLVDDVTTHPAYRNAVPTAGLLYEFQSRPENIELMTFRPEGGARRVSPAGRCHAITRNSCGEGGRYKPGRIAAMASWVAPPIMSLLLWSASAWASMSSQSMGRRAQALSDYVDHATRSDLFLTYVIVNPQADRSKDWGEQGADEVDRPLRSGGDQDQRAAAIGHDKWTLTPRSARLSFVSSLARARSKGYASRKI